MKIFKFGGTSVGSSENIGKVIQLVAKEIEDGEQICVVSSALSGITNLLINSGEKAAANDNSYKEDYRHICEQHNSIVKELGLDNDIDLKENVNVLLEDLRELLHGLNLIREYTPRSKDLVSSFGERLSCRIINSCFKNSGIASSFLDARNIIQTNDAFGNARVNFDVSNEKINAHFSSHKEVQVVTGFIASTDKQETTTLGRGGSDYTAAIIAGALNADEVQIWTDVDGILTADPRKVKKAFPLEEVSFIEAMEMSHFGAKVIYPPTVLPLINKQIPIRIKNTFNPSFHGTLITDRNENDEMPVKGVSSIDQVALINVEGGGMVGVTGIASRMFQALSRNEINIILITQASSEFSICIAVDPENADAAVNAINEEFELEIGNNKISKIVADTDVSVVAVIGENMKQTPGIAGKLFSSLGKNGINVIAVAQGSSEYNVSVVVSRKDLSKALNSLHEAFFLSDKMTLHVFMVGVGLIGSALIEQMKRQSQFLEEQNNIKINISGIANSRKMLFDESGIDLDKWKEGLDGKGEKMSLDAYVERMLDMNLANSVFVDNTASPDLVTHYKDVLENSISIVTPNKRACSESYASYSDLKASAVRNGVLFLYETNVGAGLPVINTLNDLINSGDKVEKVEAVLSGTLSYIFNKFKSGDSFTEVVRTAQKRGFTEPDPRDDLNGKDVARKILIIARETGLELEPEDIMIESLIPEECLKASTVDEFYSVLATIDDQFSTLINKAEKNDQKLCVIAKLEKGEAKVNLESVSDDHPFYSLSGSDNIISYTTERYHERPLVVKGPGAGAEVTAAGVFADIIRISHFLF